MTLTGSATSVVFGSPVTLTAVVSPASGVDVTFEDNGATLSIERADNTGHASYVIYLNAGTHSMTAQYGGDSFSAPSVSTPLIVTVSQVASNLSITAMPNPATSADSIGIACRMPVLPIVSPPTGTLTIKDGAATLLSMSGPLSYATTTASLSAGTHLLSCTYTGDTNYKPDFASMTLIVNPAVPAGPVLTKTVVTASSNPATAGQPVTVTATVTAVDGSGPAVGGNVTFYDGTTTLGQFPIDLPGRFPATRTFVAGIHSITAVYSGYSTAYSGYSSYAGSTSAPLSLTVLPMNPLPTGTTVVGSPNPSALGLPVTFTATVSAPSANGLVPTGSVTFRDSGTTLFSAVLGAGRQVSFTIPSLVGGNHSITADYSGDNNFAPSTGNLTQVINRATTSTAITIRPDSPTSGTQVTLSATVQSAAGTPSGTVTFQHGTALLGSATLNASGVATFSLAPSAGSHAYAANYAGDASFLPSVSPLLGITVYATVSITLTLDPSLPIAGQPMILSASLSSSNSGSQVPSGSVAFFDGSVNLGSATLDSSGRAALAVGLTAGDHSILAKYSGDSRFQAASSAALAVHVSQSATLTVLSEAIGANGPVLTAVVSGTAGVPTGNVQFNDVTSGLSLGAVALAGGKAALALTSSAPVGDIVQASFIGNGASFPSSTSSPISLIAVLGGFSFSYSSLAPDALSTIFGSGLAPRTDSAPSAMLPSTLAGVSLVILAADGTSYPALLYYASPSQINFVSPSNVPLGPAQLTVTGAPSPITVGISIDTTAPALATAAGTGAAVGQVIRVHSDGSEDPIVNISDAPIDFGAPTDRLYIVLYGSGFRHAQKLTSCAIASTTVAADYSGAQSVYPGLDQVNLQLPDALRGAGPVLLTCSVGGQASNPVKLNLQ